ncbi:hypothetical protein [Sphingomonas sp.]|uniref:hypothetical protein n=1 Tax=Sphingomonas sp. TaxID=28214 RepID=UPI002600E7A9|nr:hypothetical protein [Sphingomonas sp.]
MAYDPEKYPPTGCKPCPYPAGAIVAAILWALLGINGPIAEVASTAAITGLVGGLFGGSASRFLSSGMARR